MRIQTRLFLIIASLVLALVGVQWWLQVRQLHALETELAHVAATVSEDLVFTGALPHLVSSLLAKTLPVVPVPAPPAAAPVKAPPAPAQPPRTSPAPPAAPSPPEPHRTERHDRESAAAARSGARERVLVRRVLEPRMVEEMMKLQEEMNRQRDLVADRELRMAAVEQARKALEEAQLRLKTQPIEIRVERLPEHDDQVLIVSGVAGGDRRISVPRRRTEMIVRSTLRQGVLASTALLGLGLIGAAVIANRVGRPLRRLAAAAEQVGRGELGATIPVTARGEVGELQVAFNRMSEQLAGLEAERAAWQEREHLAQLGDLARGLGHTLRNPLNTLGLAVEELAEQAPEQGRELAATARGQIRRIDRWLRSFLALGAGSAAQREEVDLAEVVRAVAFEASQQGCSVEVVAAEEPVIVRGVPGALRAALANLVENACQASPAGEPVQVRVEHTESEAVVRIRDRGDGLPEEVRARLFEPHVTTRAGGSGMGLFLARQLVEGSHGGRLHVGDAPEGGTEAVITLPAPDAAGEPGGE